MGFIMMAYGFQGSLLGVRAVAEDFSLISTGFMMSGYFVGYFIGAKSIPILFLELDILEFLLHLLLLHLLVILASFSFYSSICLVFIKSSYRNKYGLVFIQLLKVG